MRLQQHPPYNVEPHTKLLLDSSTGNNLEAHRTSSPDLLALSGSQHYYNQKVLIFILENIIIDIVIDFDFVFFQLAV